MASSRISTSKVWHGIHHDQGNVCLIQVLRLCGSITATCSLGRIRWRKSSSGDCCGVWGLGRWYVGDYLSYIDQVLSCQDACEFVLLSLLLLFCSDDLLDLKERGKVEEIQTKVAVLLQNYLNTK